MAGFIDNNTPQASPVVQKIRDSVKKLSKFGMKYDDMVIRNSQAVGVTEAAFLNKSKTDAEDESMIYTLAKQDITSRQFISYFDKDYKAKRDYLRTFSLNPEIEWVLDTICDESISYDPSNFFAYPSFIDLSNLNEKIKDDLYEVYKQVYDVWGFSDDITAWQYFRQFVVEGFLAFEIVYDNDGINIIGFKELDAITLIPSVEKQLDGSYLSVWIQYPQDIKRKRILYEPQIIYMSYAKGNSISRVSYMERLIRPYNILRIIEYTRVIWAVMNASFKLKMTIPIGTKSQQKGMQTLGELMSIYKEDIQLNDESGELTVDGRPKMQFYKNYLMPSGVNGTPTVEPINTEGPNLNDMQPLSYFFDKYILESKVPPSRFHNPDGGSTSSYSNGAEGLDKEEIRFAKFISRLRSSFQDILLKPLWIQMVKKHEALANDFAFKSQLGLDYWSDNPFKLNQEIAKMTSNKDGIIAMGGLMGDDETPFFSNGFLIESYLGLSKNDIDANKEAIARKKKNKKTAGAPASEEASPEGEAPETTPETEGAPPAEPVTL
jgi:hypothetical protein